MNTKPEITDEEIRSYMNFDGLMQDFKATPRKPLISTPVKIVSLLGGIIVVSLVSYYIGLKNQDSPKERVDAKSNSEISSLNQKTEITTVANDSIAVIPDKENSTLKKESVLMTLSKSKKTAEGNDKSKPVDKKSDSTKVIQTSGYLQAEPINGFPHLYEYFSSELKYPEEAVKDSIQGIVTVNFIIATEGKPEKIIVQNSLGLVFDKEVMRLIENMPAWKPATMNGTAVPSKISMPLTFRLERIKK